MPVIEASVATHYQCLALVIFKAVENRLNKVFQIIGLLENLHLFAQTGCARALIGVGLS